MNISSLKTPGVYINEIDAFPPSVAQVATAIPAFIGFTEKGPSTPTRISSFMEYEQIFGFAPKPTGVSVEILDGIPTDNCTVTESIYKLYNSLNLFYANGGGECYIVSIGGYGKNPGDAAAKALYTGGIVKLEKYDEPTLLLFPDAINLSAADLGAVQVAALMQCNSLMDRFAIFDVKQDADLITSSDAFRQEIGNQFLKYGAAYFPHLQTNFPYKFRFNDINGTAAGKVDFNAMYATDTKVKPQLDKFNSIYSKVYNNIAPNDINNGFAIKWNEINKDKMVVVADFSNVDTYVTKMWNLLKILASPSALVNANDADLKKFIDSFVPISLKPLAQKLVDFKEEYDTLQTVDGADANNAPDNLADLTANPNASFDDIIWRSGNFAASPVNTYDGALETSALADLSKIQAALDKLFGQIVTAMNSSIASIENYILTEENNVVTQIPVYAQIIAKLSKAMNTVPPSGAVAGIYAQTDATRGVWKAPANVSITNIVGLTDDINDKEQENMNIHETGKSINAIRKFTGRGTLVWGARTLDGNSNDWRYINVRRLANMIEESVKKACMRYVFEPNVAQTWVNVKGMIENFLTVLWNDGALAGAKPEHAFFVAVGLNQTMSAQDILEGRMIVKIGYAPSRPAEFIVLEFVQQQQKS
ncbi:MAG: phage tail sheath subtilisin-like domain-containing protein [Bacteroidetes bacterium]|nr:phage tail sheath subtilisin-like domain-containing protein [Bacteroidota bacterium]